MIGKPHIDKFGQIHPPRPTVPVRLPIVVALLLTISFGARQTRQRFVASFEAYEPPTLRQIQPAGNTTPVAQRAVLVIVSGLRTAESREMSNLEQLRSLGAQAEVRASWPTFPRTAWATLLSGATPELNGVVALVPPDTAPHPISIDHLLERARVMRRTTGLVGHKLWESTIQTGSLTEFVVAPGRSAEDDRRLIQQAVDILASRPPDLMVIQLSQLEVAGHTFGGASDEYFRATQRVDILIGRLASVVDLQSAVLAVTSDHGHLDQGGHGGAEDVVATVPLVLVGPGVRPGRYDLVDQIDIAPTLAALLGLPIPAASQGTVRFEMLDVGWSLQAEQALGLAEQQITLSDAYLRAIEQAGLSGAPAHGLVIARTAVDLNNPQGAFQIARQSDQDARQEMTAGRAARIADERGKRRWAVLGAGILFVSGILLLLSRRTAWLLGVSATIWLGPLGNADALADILKMPGLRSSPLVAGGALLVTALVWARRTQRWARLALAVAALGTMAVLTYIRVESVSPSAFGSLEAYGMTLVWHVSAALVAGGVAASLLVWPEGHDLGSTFRTSYWFVFVLLAGMVIQLAAGFWLLGPGVTWYLPEPNLVYWHITGLIHTLLIAGLGTLLPVAIVVILRVMSRLQRRATIGSGTEVPEVGRVRP